MPMTHFELTGISCRIAGRIVDAGVGHLRRELFSTVDPISFACAVNGEMRTQSSYYSGDYIGGPSVIQEVAGLYLICMIPLLISWYYLRRKRASTRDVFYWGALSLFVPVLGPLVTLALYRAPRHD